MIIDPLVLYKFVDYNSRNFQAIKYCYRCNFVDALVSLLLLENGQKCGESDESIVVRKALSTRTAVKTQQTAIANVASFHIKLEEAQSVIS